MAIALVEKALSVTKFSQLVAAKAGAIPVRALDNTGLKFEVYEDADEPDGPGFRVWVVSTTDAEDDTRLADEWFVGSATVSAVAYDVYAQPLTPSEAEAFKPGAFLGAWVSGDQYSNGDMVSYSGGLYTAKNSLRDNSTDPVTDAGTNWTLMLDATGKTPAELLADIKTVDGTGSGLDADLLALALFNDTATTEIDTDAVTNPKIQNGAVSNAKLVDIAQNIIKGRITASVGDVEDLSAAQVRTIINVEDGATADQTASEILTAIKTVDGTGSGLDADLLDGQEGSYHLDRANHTGTQTLASISDSGALAALGTVGTSEIDDEAVTLPKMAHIATASIMGRVTASTGDVEVLTAAQVRTLINVEDGATGDQTASELLTAIKTVDGAASGLDADLLDGQEGSYHLDRANHTGTQTLATISDSGALAALDTVSATEIDTNAVTNPKIQNGAVSNAKLADIAQNILKGRITASIGDVEDLSAAQVRTILNVEDGATADQAWGDITGTLSSQTDLQTALDDKADHQDLIRWAFTDFNSYDVRAQGPFIGTAVNTGTSAASTSGDTVATTGFGWAIVTSSTSANSGYRWDTLHPSTGITVGLTWRCILRPTGSIANRVGTFGMTDTPMQNAPTHGIFFSLANLTLTPTVERSNTQYTGSTYVMTADTTYVLEMYQNTIDDTIFRVYAAPDETTKTQLQASTLHNVTVTNAGTDWNENVVCRAGIWCGSSGTTAEELAAFDYLGFGFQRGNS
jgi:hypothetical protein